MHGLLPGLYLNTARVQGYVPAEGNSGRAKGKDTLITADHESAVGGTLHRIPGSPELRPGSYPLGVWPKVPAQ